MVNFNLENQYQFVMKLIETALIVESKLDILKQQDEKFNKKYNMIKKYSIFIRKILYTIELYLIENEDKVSYFDYFLINDIFKCIVFIQDFYIDFINCENELELNDLEEQVDKINDNIKSLRL